MTRFKSHSLDLPSDRSDVARADLIFYGVDHSGPTYEARVFLDNPRANEDTPLDAEVGYAGSYTVFGHGGCFGGEGHCAPKDRYFDQFDRRPPHPLAPQTMSLTITDALARIAGEQVKVNIVPVVRKEIAEVAGTADVSPCESVRLVTYA